MKEKRNMLKNNNIIKKQKTNLKEQGITLVALVVTIIILLILAGVAINMALGDNGLFKRSKEAVNTWKSAEDNETAVLDYLDREWNNLINGGTSGGNPPTPQKPVLTGTTVDDIVLPSNPETPTTITVGGEEVTIPPKFTIAEDSGKTVLEGIAVVDPQGNEWVWIPCYVTGGKGSNISGRIKYDRYIFKDQVFDETDSSKIYYNSARKLYYFHETLSATSAEYQSIQKYGGYYIGRYEAGDKDLSDLETPRKRTSSDKGDTQTHIVSIKKNQIPYNYVTQAQCISLSEGMTSIDGTDTNKLNGNQVFTKLCSSYSWDTALMFIQKTHSTYGSDSKTKEGTLVDVTSDNGSNGTLANTGSKSSVCSIYDMGGNLCEYTTESYTYEDSTYVNRGGNYSDDASGYPAGNRNSSGGYAAGSHGFRSTLFVK